MPAAQGLTVLRLRPSANEDPSSADGKSIKLVIWDLDNTVWDGILLEGGPVRLREGVKDTITALDLRGILHSIASKNDPETAMNKLHEFGLYEYFLYPQVNWNSKAANVRKIVESINIGMDSVAFIDDDPFEREEIQHSLPEVLVLGADALNGLLQRAEFSPPFVTEDSARRRKMYLADLERKRAEEEFVGPQEEFLASLNMRFSIAKAQEEDLQRAEELTVRTHQLNTTGYTYSYDQLNTFCESSDHLLFIASLEDKFGDYGKIGLVLVEKGAEVWTVKLLLMSCRVISRGVGTILLNYILMLARNANVRLCAEFRANGKNRMMLVTYKFAGFREVEKAGDLVVLEHDLQRIQVHPAWVDFRVLNQN